MRRFRGHKRPHETLVDRVAPSACYCCFLLLLLLLFLFPYSLPFACWISICIGRQPRPQLRLRLRLRRRLTLCASPALDCCLSWPAGVFRIHYTHIHIHTHTHIHPIGSGVGSWFIPLRIINAHILIIAGLGSQTSASAVGVLFSLLFDLNLF